MRFLLLMIISVAIALGLGGWTAERVLDANASAQTVKLGVWTADPLAGSVDANPYEKARLSRSGDLTLGLGEGVRFSAFSDAAGAPLRLECGYRLAGELPLARAWTLAAFTLDGRLIQPGDGRPGWLVSRNLMRDENNAVAIDVGPSAEPGNWLSVTGQGPFALVLTLYDTPASSASGLGQIEMLSVTRTVCADV